MFALLLLYYVVGLGVGLVGLWYTGDSAVKYSVETATKFRLSALFVGFVLIAVSTGLPELALTIISLFENASQMSAGAILGSNICDISLVIGLSVLIGGTIKIIKKEQNDSFFILLITTFAMAFVFALGVLTRITGLFLICSYFASIYFLWRSSTKKEIAIEKKGQAAIVKDHERFFNSKFGVALKLILSILFVLLFSDISIRYALKITKLIGLSMQTIGSTILAIATSLPELTLGITAVRKKEYALALGNSLGSVLEQGTLILGILALASNEPVLIKPLNSLMPFMFASFLVLAFAMIKRKKIIRLDAILMLVIYVAFLIYQLVWVK